MRKHSLKLLALLLAYCRAFDGDPTKISDLEDELVVVLKAFGVEEWQISYDYWDSFSVTSDDAVSEVLRYILHGDGDSLVSGVGKVYAYWKVRSGKDALSCG